MQEVKRYVQCLTSCLFEIILLLLMRILVVQMNCQTNDEHGVAGLGHKDHHWLAKPLTHVPWYDLDHKAQWLE
jgi:hypothetical protein